MKKKNWAVALCFFWFHMVNAQTGLERSLGQAFDKLLASRDVKAPGAVIIASMAGKPFYEKAVGLASRELGTPLTTDAVFEAASVSKQFTATAVLKLIESGRLTLEDDIRTYIPELPDYGQTMTIRHLLTMTSGLRDWRNITYLMGRPTYEHVYTQDEALEIISEQQGLNFLPGEQYSYSNSNYDLLAILVSRLADDTFIDYATENVLRPVQFEYAHWRGNPYTIVPNKAQPYDKAAGKYVLSPVVEKTHGAAGMLVTAKDLIKWADFWAVDGFGSTLSTMRTQQGVLNNGDTIAYSCGGVWVRSLSGYTEVAHSGLLGGFRAWIAHYPALGLSVAYLTNDKTFALSEVRGCVEKVLQSRETGHPAPAKQPISASLIRQLAGHYRNTKGFHVAELKQQGEVLKLGADTIYSLTADTLLIGETRFVIRDDTTLEQVGQDETIVYKKCAFPANLSNRLTDFSGTYTCLDIDLALEFVVEAGKLKVYRKPYDGTVLYPAYEDGGEVGFYGFLTGLKTVFRFSKDQYGQRVLYVSIPRAENFRFAYQMAENR
ncbi:CubicO group peptidase, beta-lactamase class C family [Parapedobacter luteus]|uniref:CubicO group peptidase, beta-lactamase class C family n=1 Tax=Parapedobacter luteus TaxID=623280 RepID=A0A1T5CV01_9SPHI|nr:serine hydrolase domain-containing protein [Parapedobacter luteus]SKB63358.1 CubicO group peptidase, beta-lactamase class C family [Parapedobacter luteus]